MLDYQLVGVCEQNEENQPTQFSHTTSQVYLFLINQSTKKQAFSFDNYTYK